MTTYPFDMVATYSFDSADDLPETSADEVRDLIHLTEVYVRRMLGDAYAEFEGMECEYKDPFDFDYTRLLVEFGCKADRSQHADRVFP